MVPSGSVPRHSTVPTETRDRLLPPTAAPALLIVCAGDGAVQQDAPVQVQPGVGAPPSLVSPVAAADQELCPPGIVEPWSLVSLRVPICCFPHILKRFGIFHHRGKYQSTCVTRVWCSFLCSKWLHRVP